MAQSFLDELRWRGMLSQTAGEGVEAHLAGGARTAYCGFDPTADSLTLGNFVALKLLAHWQRAGHRPIVVVGGGTGLIGDPSGKSAERQLLDPEQVKANIAGQRRIFERMLDFSGPNAAIVVDNGEWLGRLGYIEVLRDVGKHFSVNQMIVRDSVASRLNSREQGISYTEFSYMILQAYDFLHLHRTQHCTVQLGGSDQFGNIVSGIDLIRRCGAREGDTPAASFGVTAQLLTKADGGKFGKSEQGAVWLTADRTSPYRLHQYLLNSADADVVKFLRWLTFLPSERIAQLEAEHATNPGGRDAHRALADELVTLLHGSHECARAAATAKALFSGDVQQLDAGQVADVAGEVPSWAVPADRLAAGIPLVDALADSKVLAASKREAREFLQAGSVMVNGVKASAEAMLAERDLMHGRAALVRRGKKQWCAIVRVG
jgi:tyrosyl-tRNA synthetase